MTRHDYIKEAFRESCIRETDACTQQQWSSVEIFISNWLEVLNMDILGTCAEYKNVSLIFDRKGARDHANENPTARDVALRALAEVLGARITELKLLDGSLSWNDGKLLLNHCVGLKSLYLQHCGWLSDAILEVISKRFSSSLQSIRLENCGMITNNGLFQLGRRCKGLICLSVVCCSKVTDVGLLEIAKNNHIAFLRLAHSTSFSDKGLEVIIGGAQQLHSLEITNCPLITDQSLSYLYEVKRKGDMRRTTAASHLRILKLSDNSNFSHEGFLWVAAGAPNLRELSVVECPRLDFSRTLCELTNLRFLTKLTLGPASAQCDPTRFVDALTTLGRQLQFLRLDGLFSLHDEHFGHIIERFNQLTTLELVKVFVGTAAVEALCSYNPDIQHLEIAGSNILQDADLRCLCSVCQNLIELRVRNCSLLTDAGFTRLASLRKLRIADFDGESSRCTGILTKYLSLCPLTELSLSSLSLDSVFTLECLKPSTRQALKRLCFQNCDSMSTTLVASCLEQFVGCKELNLTLGAASLVEQLTKLKHTNPFLSWRHHHDFTGFDLHGHGEDSYVQFWAFQRVLRRHYGARLLQCLWRKHKLRKKMLRQLRRELWNDFRLSKLIIIQSLFRGFVARKKRDRIRIAVDIVGRAMLTFVTRKKFIKYLLAKRHHDMFLTRHSFFIFHNQVKRSQYFLDCCSIRVRAILRQNLLRMLLNLMKKTHQWLKSQALQDSITIMWEINIFRSIFQSWKTVISQTSARKRLLSKFFLLTVPIERWNSTRQIRLVRLAQNFRSHRLMLLGWVTIARDRLNSRRVELLTPLAVEHFQKNFFSRVVGKCFHNFKFYKILKIRKIENLARAQQLFSRQQLVRVLWSLDIFERRSRNQKEAVSFSQNRFNKAKQKHVLRNAFPDYKRMKHRGRHWMRMGIKHHSMVLRERGYWQLLTGIIEYRRWRELNAKAKLLSKLNSERKTFANWCIFRQYSRNLGALYFRKYQMKLLKKTFAGFRLNVVQNQEKIRAVTNELTERAGGEAPFQMALMKIILFQAKCRGLLAQRKFHEQRIQKLYSIQVLQNFFRTLLARKEYMSRFKKKDISDKVHEDIELDRMRDAELEMRFFLYQEKAIIDIQRTVRGWLGRKLFAILAIEHFRNLSKEFYEDNHHFRLHHEAFKRAAIAREQLRHNAAIEIQRIARGYFGRKKFQNVSQNAKVARYAVNLQRAYRKRLARLELEALRRDKLSDIRYKAARKQRGALLRSVGFGNRKKQFALAPALESAGLDPISFNYRITELITETINDFCHLMEIFKREKNLFQEHGFNKLNLSIARRKIISDNGWKFSLQDAVRIVEPEHPFEGFTGKIVRIDESLAGLPLFEVKLDRFPRQTFVRMTTDPVNIYTKTQSLAKIMKCPEIVEGNENTFLIFSHKLGVSIDKKTIRAAWTIQRAYRSHRARKIAARRRYEHWIQCIARQWSILYHFADHNSLNTQGYNAALLLGVRSVNPPFFDEIRHKILPGRLTNVVSKPNERRVINREFDWRYKDRVKFLQKSGLVSGKEPFSVGFERLTFQRKIALLLHKSLGLVTMTGFSLKNIFGAKGIRSLTKHTSSVSGTDKFCFKQFQHSPHVRYNKASLYQGEWSGIPLFTPLRPHGEGLVVLLDAWGFAKEDKVLYLTIIRCRHLNVMDVTTSDPYCDIFCNGTNLQTSVKWRNLNPQYHESFEIDVTNPLATLNIQVKDKDYLGSDDFMGQIVLNLSDFADGLEHQGTYQLKSEDITLPEDYDRGEIELRVRWAERIFEDEQERLEIQRKMVVRIQSWKRRIIALLKLYSLREERIQKLTIVRLSSVKITSICRVRLAKKEFKRRMRKHKTAIKIQKRVRIWIARRVLATKKMWKKASTRIQTQMRIFLAKRLVRRMRDELAANVFATVATIQKYVRRWLSMRWLAKQKIELARARKLAGLSGVDVDPVSKWIHDYGVDPEYGLKRNRRITERLFSKMLRTRFVRILSRFGVVYVDSYPPRKTEEEMLQEVQNTAVEPLTLRDDFVSVFLPTFDPMLFHRATAITQFQRFNHTAVLHLKTSVEMKKSVYFLVTSVQCAQRQRVAKAQYAKMLRVHKAITLFQKHFRRRFEKQHKAAVRIVAMFRRVKAKSYAAHVRREKLAAITLQSAYRCFRSRSAFFDLRSVDKLAVLRSTPSLPMHGPEKCLEHRDDTFWIADSPEKAELRVEFGRSENIVEIWVMTSTFAASPNYLSISAVRDKKSGYDEVVERTELPFLVGDRWHRFFIPVISTKYFMLTFSGNYGDDKYISVRQIRFVRSKESSVKIIKQPPQYVLDPGPRIGVETQISLVCEATGWPLPTYQWYRNEKLLEGETSSHLNLLLLCPTIGARSYRCLKCKMVSQTLPVNAYHIKCGNCGYLLVLKEVEDFDKQIIGLRAQEEDLHKTKAGLLSSKVQMESFNNPKYKSLLLDLEERLILIEEKLQVLQEARVHVKEKNSICNPYTSEGIYTCVVQNIRGGGLKIKRKSISSVVVIERPDPYVVEVQPFYVPRVQGKRKKWNIYSTILGTFRAGRIDGLCCIRYNDNSFYEGPYVGEDAVDFYGKTKKEYRAPDHYGIYHAPDGRIFEGFNVDNHFDVNNLQSFYRVTFPNNEVYEGNFCDEQFHGIGMMIFEDQSVYEGQWHRGLRFGHGHFRSSEGWTYEGFFDKNRRHRCGTIDWPDGSCYMGDWYYDKIQGSGCLITPLRDVYRGEMLDGKFHGHGEIVYADGSTYVGEFINGLRQGKGVFIEREGGEYFGHFENDLRHGEHVVKVIIPIEEVGQDNYEIRVGVYEFGNLVKWKSKFSNPIATKQFVALFRQNREMFDSVYAMILAKNLPNLPEGIDGNDPGVKAVTVKIRTEAGMLVGQQALNQAKAQLDALFGPLGEKKRLVENIKKEIEALSMSIISLEKESSEAHARFSIFFSRFEKDTAKIEQHWLDEPTQVRAAFLAACKKLDTLSVDDYFSFRNHRVVPVFVKKIFDAISYLLGASTEWSKQQMIVGDSIANGRNGDEEALRLDYKCKLSYMMKSYRVFDHIHISEMDALLKILADVRFRSDSYYIESTGSPGPILVEWVKTNFAYIRAAEKMFAVLNAAEEKRVAAFRLKAVHTKKKEEIFEVSNRLEVVRQQLLTAQIDLEDTQLAVLKANNLLQFIAGRFQGDQAFAKQDYYKLLEKKMEEKKDRFTIEVCLRGLVDHVIQNNETEQQKAMLTALSMGKSYEPPVLQQQSIVGWIREEILSQQSAIVDGGRTLGYSFEPESTDISTDFTAQVISLIVDITVSKLNDALNDLASSISWISRKGKKISRRFLFIIAWKIWKEEALIRRDELAVQMWESIFGDTSTCALMAVEARVSNRMSSVAKSQAFVWIQRHKAEVSWAEQYLSDDFAKDFESVDLVAQSAIDIENDTSDAISPSLRARSSCWAKLHPEEMRMARDRHYVQFSQAFEEKFGKDASFVCFKLLNGLGIEDELEWLDYAVYWKDFHVEEYEAAADATIDELAKDFIDAYPLNTYLEAAKMIHNDRLSKYIQDDEVRAQYAANPKQITSAYCWGVRNQGLLRKGKEALFADNRNNYSRMWNDLNLQTDNLTKGSALHVVRDDNGNDRFVGYRNRLSSKFAWVYGYLQFRLELVTQEMHNLDFVDPIEKVMHRVRPSQLKDTAHFTEESFIKTKNNLESEYSDIVSQLSAWNSYFGWLAQT